MKASKILGKWVQGKTDGLFSGKHGLDQTHTILKVVESIACVFSQTLENDFTRRWRWPKGVL